MQILGYIKLRQPRFDNKIKDATTGTTKQSKLRYFVKIKTKQIVVLKQKVHQPIKIKTIILYDQERNKS